MMTPEQVQLEFEVAGIGSRAMAQLIDILLLVGANGVLWGGLAAWDTIRTVGTVFNYVAGFGILLTFISFWAYFILFEYFSAGQTIGKRIVKIRVIRNNGMSLSFFAALVRNLIRLLDLLPGIYTIGLITMIIDKKERRIGDLAAGTIVVKDILRYQLGLLDELESDVTKTSKWVNKSLDSPVYLAVESKAVRLIIEEKPPADLEHTIRKFARRKKQMTKKASEQVAQMLFGRLQQLSIIQVEPMDGRLEIDTMTISAKVIMDMIVKLGRELDKRH